MFQLQTQVKWETMMDFFSVNLWLSSEDCQHSVPCGTTRRGNWFSEASLLRNTSNLFDWTQGNNSLLHLPMWMHFLNIKSQKRGNIPAYSSALVVVHSTRDKTTKCKLHQRRAPSEYTNKIRIINNKGLLFKHNCPS